MKDYFRTIKLMLFLKIITIAQSIIHLSQNKFKISYDFFMKEKVYQRILSEITCKVRLMALLIGYMEDKLG